MEGPLTGDASSLGLRPHSLTMAKRSLSVGRLLFLTRLLRELLNAAQILTKEGRCGIFLSLVIHLMMIINK
jgi:hypothetical protein